MKETGENMWLNNLPRHSPGQDLWEKIESSLDNEFSQERYKQQLAAGLPEHQPPFTLWARIEAQLARRKAIRIGYITASIAAVLLIAFVLGSVLISEIKRSGTSVSPIATKTDNRIPAEKISKKKNVSSISLVNKRIPRQQNPSVITDDSTEEAERTPVPELPETTDVSAKLLPLTMLPVAPGNGTDKPELPIAESAIASVPLAVSDTSGAWLMARAMNNPAPPRLPKTINSRKGFSLGFDYLPEPVSNPENGTSLYQTFGLLAKYEAPDIELRSGIGISYYSVPVGFSTQYLSISNSSNSPGVFDTIVYNGDTIYAAEAMTKGINGIDIHASERSKFLNYSLGAGKRIYSDKKLSATLQVGAGFSFLLSEENNLQSIASDVIKNSHNAYSNINSIESNLTDINQTRFNLLTGFDFNYHLLKNWSISVEPTVKYYFSPIYNGRNSKTFSTGLRTGILFKL